MILFITEGVCRLWQMIADSQSLESHVCTGFYFIGALRFRKDSGLVGRLLNMLCVKLHSSLVQG